MMPLLSSYEDHVSLRVPYVRKGPCHDTIVSPSKNALKSVANMGLIDAQ
jgi:hypothetical protein